MIQVKRGRFEAVLMAAMLDRLLHHRNYG